MTHILGKYLWKVLCFSDLQSKKANKKVLNDMRKRNEEKEFANISRQYQWKGNLKFWENESEVRN